MKLLVILSLLALTLAQVKIPLKRLSTSEFSFADKRVLYNFLSKESPHEDHRIKLVNQYNMLFYGSLEIGTPSKQFNIIFDTGSSNLWVPLVNCSDCQNKQQYDSSQSSTYVADGRNITLAYMSGTCSGIVGNDTVNFAGKSVKGVGFGIMDTLAPAFVAVSVDGILGMGFNALSLNNLPTVFELMYQQKLIKNPIYAFYFSKDPNQDGSELTLGDFDPSHAATDFKFYPVTKANFWTITMADVGVGNTSVQSGNITAIVDTGSGRIFGPIEPVMKIKSQLPATFDCKNRSQYPNLYITLGNDRFEISPDFYLIEVETYCFFAISEAPLDKWILGDVFLRQYYTIFDYGQQRVGFATAK